LESKESIIIIDDDESTCKTLALIFKKQGYEIETVGTGHEALKKVKERDFNLAILDVKLPDIEGVELLGPLKKISPFMDIIMITEMGTLETAVYALNNGASSYITKPLKMDDILNAISVIIEEQKFKKQSQKSNDITTNENILIVDDDESTCKTLALIFNKKGYNVQTAGTGYEALEIARKNSFNLVLLDIKLPDVEGIELLIPLKKMHPDMETMMMTAYSSLETVIGALNKGASAYIMKPLEIDDILKKISTVFEKQRLIVEKKKLEQELAYQALLVEKVSDAIISTDKNLKIKSWNKAAENMYGWNSNEVIGKPLSEIIPEEYPYAQKGEVNEQIFENGFWMGEITQKKRDNTLINIFSSSTLIRDNMGKIQGVVTINQDFTKRKKVELKLIKETEKIKKYLDIAGVILVVLDKRGNIVMLNKKGYEILQYTEGELIGRNWFDIYIPKENPKEIYEIFKKLMRNESQNTEFYENSILTKSGEEMIIAWHSTLLYDNNGEIIGTLSSGGDITELKKGEQDLLSTLENLKEVNSELERFAYVASHDLQEPLRMITSFIQLLEKRYKDKLDEEANEFITFIVDGAKRMQLMISDLLFYSRIGRKEKEFSQLDVNIILENVISNLRIKIEETNAKITHDPLPILIGNEAEFVQLLQNLIYNAIKFHRKEETPVVHISAKFQKNQWIFSVRDNGIGIDSQFFDRIFIIFQRLHKKEEYDGTGIGLAICKKIIERHDGKIWVESEVGKGSTFYFSIPKKSVRNYEF